MRKLPQGDGFAHDVVSGRPGWGLGLDRRPPATYASSPGVTRSFCGTCGTQMAFRAERFPHEIHFYAATLDRPEDYQPTTHYFSAEQLPWLHLADGLARR